MSEIGIRFGALSPPLLRQLSGLNVPAGRITKWQKMADAITMLALHDLLSGSEVVKARKKLMRQIAAGVSVCQPQP